MAEISPFRSASVEMTGKKYFVYFEFLDVKKRRIKNLWLSV